MVEADGARLVDVHGRRYIDAMGGLWCVNIGYGRGEMVEAITEQARKMAYYHLFFSMSHEPAIRLADKLLQMLPDQMSKIFFCNSGSEANDTQVKIVWYYNNLRGKPEKRKIISRHKAYHGVTAVAASLTGLPALHKAFNLPLDGFLHTTAPHHYWEAAPGMSEREFSAKCAADLEAMIQREGPDTVAAFIAEPVMGAGGVITPPEGYFEAIQQVLHKYDVLFITDEVITGFGRLGTWFGTDYYRLEPDLMTMAKGLTSAYVPMSAVAINDKVWEVLRAGSPEIGPFAHGYTYGGHPLAAAAGLKTIEIMEREDIVGQAARTGVVFQKALRDVAADHPLVGEVRGIGMIAGVELVADKAAKTPFPAEAQMAPRLAGLMMQEGVVTRGMVNTLAFSPPLVIKEDEITQVTERLGRSLDRLASELAAEGSWKAA